MKPTYEELLEENAKLRLLVDQLMKRIADLEDRLNKNSKNSSKPSSTDQKSNLSPRKAKKDRTYHPGASRQLLPESSITSRETRVVETCPHCGSTMKRTDKVISWQQVELPEIKPLVHQIDLHTCQCPKCQATATPKLEEHEKYLMGPRLEATVNICLGQFRHGHRSAREFISILIPNLKLSQGVISKVKVRGTKALALAHKKIHDTIIGQKKAIYVDATSWRHMGKNEHAIVLRSGNHISLSLVPHQNGKTLANLVNNRKISVLVTDRGLAASCIEARVRQYCLAHLLRNICGLAEHPATTVKQTELLGEIYDGIQQLFRYKHRLDREEITESTWRSYSYATWGYLEERVREIVYSAPEKKLKRACRRMLKDWKHFKAYLRNREYPMTNNPAEEALRNLVITRKLCFGSRSEYGRSWRSAMQSCVETLRREGRPILDFLTEALKSSRYGTPYPAI